MTFLGQKEKSVFAGERRRQEVFLLDIRAISGRSLSRSVSQGSGLNSDHYDITWNISDVNPDSENTETLSSRNHGQQNRKKNIFLKIKFIF